MNKFIQLHPNTGLSILRRTVKFSPLALGALALAAASGVSYGAPTLPTGERLRDLADASGIRLGAAIPDFDHSDPANDFDTVAKREFNFFTSENEMKFFSTERPQGTFIYDKGQRVVDLANSAGGKVHGHNFVWFKVPSDSWVSTGSWTATSLTNALNNHIDNVGSHWAGDIVAWDVVNECFKSQSGLTHSLTWQQCLRGYGAPGVDIWYDTIGNTYVEKAFLRARAAAPNALLLYNDYEIEEQNYHSGAVLDMVQDFQARGIPIDGIGAQMHMNGAHGYRPAGTVRATFDSYAALGLKTFITEFDCPPTLPDGSGGFTPQSSPPSFYSLDRQARSYQDALDMALRSPGFSGFQIWSVKNNSGSPKGIFSTPSMEALPAYYAIQDALSYQQRGELALNGRVEDGTLSPWSGTANGTSTIAATTTNPHSGTTSILVSGRSASSAGPGQSVKTELLAQGSGRYYLRAWMRTASGTGTGKLSLRLQDSSGTHYLGVAAPISTTWTEVSGWVNAKWFKTLSSAVLYAETPGSTGNFYVDDVTLSDGNLLKNSSFGDGTTANWGTYVGGSISNVASDTALETVYKYGRNGGYVSGRTATYHGPAQNITTAMLASGPGSYEVSAWVKLKKPDATTTLAGNARITIRTDSGSGVIYKTSTNTPISSDKWTKISGTLNVGWSGALSDAKLYVETPDTTAPFYIDEVIARRGQSGSSAATASPTGPSSSSS